MPLDPTVQKLLKMLAAGGQVQSPPGSAAEIRNRFAELTRAFDDRGAAVGGVENRQIPGNGGPIAIRHYLPPRAGTGATRDPALVYFHGGAWVFCSLDTHDGICRTLCHNSGCHVISVGYRQGPEHKFPAPTDDANAALAWVAANAGDLGIDATRIAVGGDSAGATLAIASCLAAREAGEPAIALQLLLCPKTDVLPRTASRKALATGYFLEETTIAWAVKQLCPDGTDLSDWRLSPLFAPSLEGLPPAIVHTAEFDPLRDEGRAFADRLEASGVPAHYVCHAGMIHHFYGMTGVIPYARQALIGIGRDLAQALHKE